MSTKKKKPLYKRWWFIILAVLILFFVVAKNIEKKQKDNVQTVYEGNGVELKVDKNMTDGLMLVMENASREAVLVGIDGIEIDGELHTYHAINLTKTLGMSDKTQALDKKIALASYPAKYKEDISIAQELAKYDHIDDETRPLLINAGTKITFTLYFLKDLDVKYVGDSLVYSNLQEGDSEFNYVEQQETIEVILDE